MDQCQRNNIEVLSEQLGSLRITKEDISEKTIEYIDNMLTALAIYNKIVQAVIPKSIVLDPK